MMADKDVRDKVSQIEADAYALAESKGMKIVTPSKSGLEAFLNASISDLLGVTIFIPLDSARA